MPGTAAAWPRALKRYRVEVLEGCGARASERELPRRIAPDQMMIMLVPVAPRFIQRLEILFEMAGEPARWGTKR
jgi:hypothetical protein